MVHNHDNQSISQGIPEEETAIHADKWKLGDENLSSFRSQKEPATNVKAESSEYTPITNSKHDVNELIEGNKTKPEKGSKSQITINSGDSIG